MDDTAGGGPLDRDLQRTLLLAMRDCYPKEYADDQFVNLNANALEANLLYLEEHGLCVAGLSPSIGGDYAWYGSKITARGLDFLAEDGGLSAILGVVTVKLHADTVRDLIAAKIDAAPIDPAEKSTLKTALAALPEAALKTITTSLVKTGLDHVPDAILWLRQSIGHLSGG